MGVSAPFFRIMPRLLGALAPLALALSGCASVGDTVSTAFADPAKYQLWDCKQLEPERKSLAKRATELQGLMAKAETGVGGTVVAEVVYRNDYIAIRGQQKFAEEAWQRSRCHETAPAAAPAGPPVPASTAPKSAAPAQRSGNAVY